MSLKTPCRLRAALVLVGCVVPPAVWAQLDSHLHQSAREQRVRQLDIEYGSRTIPLPSLQGPPRPAGAPGAGSGGPSGPGPGGPAPGSPGSPGAGPGPGVPGPGSGGPPVPKGPGGPPTAGPSPGGPPAPKGAPKGSPGGPPRPTPADSAPTPTANGAGCEPHSPLPSGLPSGPGAGTAVYQQFPPSGAMRTAWFVTFDHAVHRGLFITSAWFKPSPERPWIKVLSDAGPSEIFVPYQSGDPRYLDLAHPSQGGAGEYGLIRASQRDAGRCGVVLGRGNAVVRELTEKGVLWKVGQYVYRGHKMTLWGTLSAGNYNYLLSYAFHDDGMIEFRSGATATNLPQKPFEAHMHNIIWRVNVDLNGAQNTVSVMRHVENTNSPSWRDVAEPFNKGREGGIEWKPREFTMLHIGSATLKNSRGSQGGYMVMPMVRGTARHMERWMRQDIWVTRYKPQEIGFQFIQRYANNEPITNADIVLWLVTSSLHLPRDEDGRIVRTAQGKSVFRGAAVVMWSGFDMKPHNILDNVPFFPAPQ